MRFSTVEARHFVRFHEEFQGDTHEIFKVCARCGGACEFNKIGTLMPGEREYMAGVSGMSVVDFSKSFLDVIKMEDGFELDVLRLSNGCPFLDRGSFQCNCRKYKVVLCEVYPIGFHVRNGRVEFSIDAWCPLSDTLRYRRHFESAGVSAISKLPVPTKWYECVERYDDLYFDYEAIERSRGSSSDLEVFPLEELLRFQRKDQANDPRERFHPYPDEVVAHRDDAGPLDGGVTSLGRKMEKHIGRGEQIG